MSPAIKIPAAEAIRQQKIALAEAIVDLQYARQRQLWQSYGASRRIFSIRDTIYHLHYLTHALEANSPPLFHEYLAWVKVLFAGLNFPADVLPVTLECTRQVLATTFPSEVIAPTLQLIDSGLLYLMQAPTTLPGELQGDSPLDLLARQFLQHLLAGQRQPASRLILDAVQNGTPVKQIYLQVFQRTQREIGRLWQTNQISVAQEHFCTAATQMIMSQLYPYIFTGERKNHRMVVACVGEELHEIGARMVADFFEMEGWDTFFLGANTPLTSILSMLSNQKADILALSATMVFHINQVAEIITDLRNTPMAHTPVLVGGYPFNISSGLWQHVGADGYAPDAESALTEANKLISV